jgi:hypothetical protein
MSQLVSLTCTGCRKQLQIDAAFCGHPLTCPSCSGGLIVQATPSEGDVPMRLKLPKGMGFETRVSKETANSNSKVMMGAFCTILGVIVALLFGIRPPKR